MTVTDGGATSSSQPAPEQASYVRLHVTPLDADLLQVVLSPAIRPKARNISYHTLETFPEKRYGFIELPDEDAEKIKNKFNGAILRGVKIHIQRARPSKIPAPLGDEAMAKEQSERSSKKARDGKDKTKKRKRAAEEVSGIVLENDRKVKRGWTTADEPREKRTKKDKSDRKEKRDKEEKKKQERSKYTDHAECLIKTVLPANAVPDADTITSKKKKKDKAHEIIVHEFEKTTKFPTFLKTTVATGPSKAPLEFVEGKGWVDEEGTVIEAVKTRPPPTVKTPSSKKTDRKNLGTVNEEDESDASSNSSNSSDDSGCDSDSDSPALVEKTTPISKTIFRKESSPAQQQPSPSPLAVSPSLPRPKSSGSVKNLAIKIPPTTPSESRIVHPLEALYKRSQQPSDTVTGPSAEQSGFSFFGNGDVDSDEEDDGKLTGRKLQVPMTPFTRQDFESRGIRSAAPTPDTAHPKGGRFKPWEDDDGDTGDADDDDIAPADNNGDGDGDDNEDEQYASRPLGTQVDGADGEKPTSDFQKWFWENRGELNRSWKKRRKTASKEKRYRENRARTSRAI